MWDSLQQDATAYRTKNLLLFQDIMKIPHSHVLNQPLMFLRSKRFCEEISDIFWAGDVINHDPFFLNVMTDGVILDIDVLGLTMVYRRSIRNF